MKDYVAKLKGKPEHIRKRIAFGASAGVTGLIALAWIGTMVTTGAFTMGAKSTVADSNQNSAPVALTDTNVKSNFSQLAGAVAAATGATTSQPSLTIIDGKASSTLDATQPAPNNSSATVIPF